MPAEHANAMIELAIDRIMTGRGNVGTLIDAACNRDRHYFRTALTPIIAEMEDDIDGFRRQRNEARDKLRSILGNSLANPHPF